VRKDERYTADLHLILFEPCRRLALAAMQVALRLLGASRCSRLMLCGSQFVRPRDSNWYTAYVLPENAYASVLNFGLRSKGFLDADANCQKAVVEAQQTLLPTCFLLLSQLWSVGSNAANGNCYMHFRAVIVFMSINCWSGEA
jgi:hypothetical protein